MPAEVRDMALGDMNHDSITDVVVANKTAVFIYNGTSTGILSITPWKISNGDIADIFRLAIGDVNDDGKDDIVISYNDTVGNPRLYIFSQAANFLSPIYVDLLYPNPRQVVIGQFDNTATKDIAVVCVGDKGMGLNPSVVLTRFPFSGSGTKAIITLANQANPQLLAMGYINSDNLQDLVVGDLYGNNFTVLTQPYPSSALSGIWGSPGPTTIGGSIADLKMFDYRHVGSNRDLVIANTGYDRVEIWNNTGSGISSSATQMIYNTGDLSSIGLGNLSVNPTPDLFVLSSSGSDCRMYSRWTGYYYQNYYSRFPVNKAPLRISTVDWGAAGKGAVVLSAGGSGSPSYLEFYIFNEAGIGNADRNLLTSGTASQVAAGNVSFQVVASIIGPSNEVRVHNLSGISATLKTQNGPGGLCFTDLDGDGYDDLAVINTNSGTVSVYRGGLGFMKKTYPDYNISLSSGQPISITAGRVNAIGMNVLVVTCTNGVEVIYDGLGTPVHEILGPSISGARPEVIMGHFNTSGNGGDIAVLNTTTGYVHIYYQTGSTVMGECYPDTPNVWLNTVSRLPTSMAGGDFNGDGLDDIAVSTISGSVYIFTNNYGAGYYPDTPTPSLPAFTLTNPGKQIRSADLNDDGLSDIVVSYTSKPLIALYLSEGTTGFVNTMNFTAGGLANGIFAGDVNGDERDDLLASSSLTPFVSYWLQHNLRPVAQAWVSSTSILEGQTVFFDASNSTDSYSDRNALTYTWHLSNGWQSTSISDHYKFTSKGSYTGYLLVTDRGGLTNLTNFEVYVEDIPPMASFEFGPNNALENTTVWFNDTSTHYDAITWHWDFGDHKTSTNQNTTHAYVQDGVYHVWLNITDTDGKQSNFTKDVTVLDRSPVAGIRASATYIDEGNTVWFYDDSSSYDPISSYIWSFPDDSSYNYSKDASHKFSVKGRFDVTFRIMDSDGDVSFAHINITVNDTLPVASFVSSIAQPHEGEPVTFNDTSYSYDRITNWYWDLGDGTISTSHNVTWIYRDSGIYHVNLTITDLDGMTSRASMTLTILPSSPYVGPIIAGDGSTEYPMDQAIQVQSLIIQNYTNSIIKIAWDFNYNAIRGFVETPGINESVTSVTYRAPGTYTICVRAYDHNSPNQQFLTLTIYDVAPVAGLNRVQIKPDNYTFYANNSRDTDTDNSSLLFRWNFDDGSDMWTDWSVERSVYHRFSVDGWHTVTVEVRDQWGNSTKKNTTVESDTLKLSDIVADGGVSIVFSMDETITFQVTPYPTYLSSIQYAWDFDYQSGVGFNPTYGITINQVDHTFTEKKQFTICVRAYDSYTYAYSYLNISILNVKPVAMISTPQELGSRNYSFDASLSWDTPSDNSTLRYSWNFGDDGWTPYTTNKNAWHQYTADGRYDVTLEVIDRWNASTQYRYPSQIILDTVGPDIQLYNSSLINQAYKGDGIEIKATVIDATNVDHVILYYQMGNVTQSINMTAVEDHSYVANVPSLNDAGTLTFWIQAWDTNGISKTWGPREISVIERPDDTIWYIVAASLATIIAILLIYLWFAKMVVDEVFIIYEDGNLIAHQTRRLKPGMDDQILGSMLVAIQNFVRDSFKDEGSTGLNRMDFGEKKVLVERGDHIYLAVVLHGTREGKVPQRMRDTIAQAETDFKEALNAWDGDLEKVRGIKDSTSVLINGSIMDALPSRHSEKEIVDISDMIECPICDAKIELDAVQCPQCGADLGTASLTELAEVADEIKKDGQ